MIQTIITIIIIGLAVFFVIRKIYKIIKSPENEFICTPDKCSSCPYKSTNECSDDKK